MNRLLVKGYINEMRCGSNFAYILEDNELFVSTQYKVLQSQANSCFVKCMKMLYNGKIQLYYLPKSLKSLSSMLLGLDDESFVTIVSNLFSDIIDVKQIGFLACENIDTSFDKIFVDPSTYKVSLTYIPIKERICDDASVFENEIRTELVKLISTYPNLSTARTHQLAADLSNGMLSMEHLLARAKSGKKIEVEKKIKTESVSGMKLVAANAPERLEIPITKDSFVIGKKVSDVDGVISFNKMISRRHCRIDRRGNGYTITDLDSANGTYVNLVKLQPNVPQPIKVGDVIRLANSDFRLCNR